MTKVNFPSLTLCEDHVADTGDYLRNVLNNLAFGESQGVYAERIVEIGNYFILMALIDMKAWSDTTGKTLTNLFLLKVISSTRNSRITSISFSIYLAYHTAIQGLTNFSFSGSVTHAFVV